ncbi:MAG: hypothetical protein CMK23_08800 [Porticoccaceae bacterium]|nr:hypothetical protein [Porticoccaceae bacterium]
MLKALIKQYEGEIAVAQATVRIYMNNSVGIGEHPQHAEEIDTLLGTIADRQDKIEAAEEMMDSRYTDRMTLNETSSV